MTSPDPAESVRVDLWLLAARCFRTRALAKEACEGGHVRLNGRSVGPDKPVRVGDMVEALTPGGRRVLRVLALAERRGGVALAQAILDDLTPPPPPDPEPRVLREAGLGRPTKRDRRTIARLRGY